MRARRNVLFAIALIAILLLPAARVGEQQYRVYLPLVAQAERLPPLRGVGMHADYADCAHAARLQTAWHYDWYENPPVCPNSEAVPMIKDASRVGRPLGESSRWVMWFNEPDIASQAGMTPEEAAALYNQHYADYADRLHVSPSVSDVARSGYGLDWLAQWLAAVDRLPDALGIHCYGAGTVDEGLAHCAEVLDRALALAGQYNVGQVWLTETCYLGPPEDQADFARRLYDEVIATRPGVTRYAWFIATQNGQEPWALGWNTSLVDFESGELTPTGRIYAGLPGDGGLAEDVNRDGCVDILDLVRVASAFGTCAE